MTQRSFSSEDFEGDGVQNLEDPDAQGRGTDAIVDDKPKDVFGDDVHEALRGKSMSEAAQLFSQLYTQAADMHNQLQMARTAPTQQPQPKPEPTPMPDFEAEDLMDGNEGRFRDKLDQFFEHKAGPYMANVNRQMATNVYLQQIRDPLFQRFKPEVDQIVGAMPSEQVANPNTWALIRSYLKDRHFDTLAREYMEASQRPTPGFVGKPKGQSETPKGSDTLTADERYIVKQLGLDPKAYLARKKMMTE